MEEINDRHQIYRPYSASCSNCRNNFDLVSFTCDAFKNGIPDDVLSGKNKHLSPTKDQENKIVFSPK